MTKRSMEKKNRRTNLLDILHPLSHLLVAHVVDILDEVVVLLPERHPDPCLVPYNTIYIYIYMCVCVLDIRADRAALLL